MFNQKNKLKEEQKKIVKKGSKMLKEYTKLLHIINVNDKVLEQLKRYDKATKEYYEALHKR